MTPELQFTIQLTVSIGIGVIIVALVKYIFTREKGLLMSKEDHHKECEEAKKDVRNGIKEEFANFKSYFDVEMENKVLKSLRNLNGSLEQKIVDIVSTQVNILSKELTSEINKKLDLVEVVKALASQRKTK